MSARVVVVFASRQGATERLATAAAVGAVEQRGEIRLRRLPDSSYELGPESAWLAKQYVPPREADVAWATALIFLAPSWLEPGSPDLQQYFASLAAQRARGRWTPRHFALVATGPTRDFLAEQFTGLGLALVPGSADDPEAARLLGHAAARQP